MKCEQFEYCGNEAIGESLDEIPLCNECGNALEKEAHETAEGYFECECGDFFYHEIDLKTHKKYKCEL